MPGVAQLGAAAHRRRGHGARRPTDPDRRVRPLQRTGRERGPAEAHVAALVLRNIVGPGGLDGPDVVVAQTSALAERQAEILELGLVPAHADAEDEAAARRLVHRGGGLGGHQGAPVRQHDDAGAEANALRPPRQIREQREGIGPVATIVLRRGRLGQDVVGNEDAVETQLLRSSRQRLRVSDRQLPDRKHDTVVHESLPVTAGRSAPPGRGPASGRS